MEYLIISEFGTKLNKDQEKLLEKIAKKNNKNIIYKSVGYSRKILNKFFKKNICSKNSLKKS